MLESISLFSAFIAGTLMFLAPCTLPLLPAYLGFISGVTEHELEHPETRRWARRHVFKNSVMFSLGFSLILILLGLSAGYAGSHVTPVIVGVAKVLGGVLVIGFGAFMVGILRPSFLVTERRIQIPSFLTIGSPSSSFLLGSAFAVGWTPCIGPVYGTILIYAGSTQTALTGALLLCVFSLGFSVPLLLLSLLIGQSARVIEKVSPYLHTISFIGGVILILIGLKLLLGNSVLTNWFFDLFTYIDVTDVLMPYL